MCFKPTFIQLVLQLSLLVCDLPITSGRTAKSADSDEIRSLLDPAVYDKGKRPQAGGPALTVEVELVVESLGPIDSHTMDITTILNLRQQWRDPRLVFNRSSIYPSGHIDNNKPETLGSSYLPLLWVPDLRFLAAKFGERHDVTTPNILLRLFPDGNILLSQLVTTQLKCRMDLSDFPHDSQRCVIAFDSYGFTADDLIFQWSTKRNGTLAQPNVHMAEFSLTSLRPGDCTSTYETGTFSCLKVRLNC